MRDLPLYKANSEILDVWFSRLEQEQILFSRKGEAFESGEAWHQPWNVEQAGKNIFWFEVAREKPSGRHVVVFGPPPEAEFVATYAKVNKLLVDCGAEKLTTLKEKE